MAFDASTSPQPYPPAPRGDDADVLHGVTVPDPYRALEAEDDPVTQAWSKAQRVLFDEHRAGAGALARPAARGPREIGRAHV